MKTPSPESDACKDRTRKKPAPRSPSLKTIPPTMGMLLPETWRMHPKICAFTSEMFYEGRLGARPITEPRVLHGHPWLNGAGLWFVPVPHIGNRNSSAEEVDVVARIAES